MPIPATASSDDLTPEPQPDTASSATGEIVYLYLPHAPLRRLRQAMQLVRQPGYSAVHEFQRRLTAAPPEPIPILVTDRRMQIGETTYALHQITSVSSTGDAKNVGCALALVGIGVLLATMLICGAALSPFGGGVASIDKSWLFGAAVLIMIGAALYRAAKEQFAVRIASASGDVDGVMSPDRETIARIAAAAETALASCLR